MTISQSKQDDTMIFVLDGRLDSHTSMQLEDDFHRAFSQGERNFIWECSKLTYLSSAGLRAFLLAVKHLDQRGGKLVIAAAKPAIVEVFEISGFKAMLILKPDLLSALSVHS